MNLTQTQDQNLRDTTERHNQMNITKRNWALTKSVKTKKRRSSGDEDEEEGELRGSSKYSETSVFHKEVHPLTL